MKDHLEQRLTYLNITPKTNSSFVSTTLLGYKQEADGLLITSKKLKFKATNNDEVDVILRGLLTFRCMLLQFASAKDYIRFLLFSYRIEDKEWDGGSAWMAPGGAIKLNSSPGGGNLNVNPLRLYIKRSLIESSSGVNIYRFKELFWSCAHSWLKDEYGLESNRDAFVIENGQVYLKPLPNITSLEI